MKKDKERDVYEDDGATIASMEGLEDIKKGQDKTRNKKVKETFKEIGFSKKETRAMIKGAYLALLPAFLIFMGCMTLVLLLIYFFW